LYLGVDDEPAELGDVLGFLATELGLPQPASESDRVSDGGAGASTSNGGAANAAAARGGEPSRGGNKRVSNGLLRSTGFELHYPSFRDGYRAILAGVGVRHP
jgi:hypothetical protein